MGEVCVLGVDPGFASFGLCVVQLLPDSERILHVDVIRTQKSNKKQNVKAADDNFRRGKAISALLHSVVDERKPLAIAAESASWPRNASASAKLAMSWGILIDICQVYSLPMVQATPQELKKAVCDKKTATKEEIRHALEERYPGQFNPFKTEFPPRNPPKPHGQWEHGFDAAGAVVACLDTDVIRMARSMAG